jgi:exopolysaccharide biosynthesis polyprenyl glycosylphosphotransferase
VAAPHAAVSRDGHRRWVWLLDGKGFNLLRLVVDAIMLVSAVVSAQLGAKAANAHVAGRGMLYVFPLLVIALLYSRGMYSTRLRAQILDSLAQIVAAISFAAMACLSADMLVDQQTQPAALLARAWAFAILYVGAGRILVAVTQRRARARGDLWRPTLIIGAGIVAVQVARRLEEQPEFGMRPVGYLDADPLPAADVVDRRAPVLGGPDDLERVVKETGARHVILAFSRGADSGLVSLIRRCDQLGIEVSVVPRMFEAINERVALDHLGGLPLLGLRTINPKGWQFAIKHALDRVFAVVVITGLAPLLGAVALTIKLSSPGPVLFRQRRVGRDGREFDMLKFRTMSGTPAEHGEADAEWAAKIVGRTIKGAGQQSDRRTSIGRLMRATSVDEMPQLFNVLKGEMSLVGPRPERTAFVSLFRDDVNRYADRHRVKSGMTGWAQVHGFRGQTSLADRVEWDNFYIENWSLWLDAKILMMTVNVVFTKSE